MVVVDGRLDGHTHEIIKFYWRTRGGGVERRSSSSLNVMAELTHRSKEPRSQPLTIADCSDEIRQMRRVDILLAFCCHTMRVYKQGCLDIYLVQPGCISIYPDKRCNHNNLERELMGSSSIICNPPKSSDWLLFIFFPNGSIAETNCARKQSIHHPYTQLEGRAYIIGNNYWSQDNNEMPSFFLFFFFREVLVLHNGRDRRRRRRRQK